MKCESCEQGYCHLCGRQSWCDCECEGQIDPIDYYGVYNIDMNEAGESLRKTLDELKDVSAKLKADRHVSREMLNKEFDI